MERTKLSKCLFEEHSLTEVEEVALAKSIAEEAMAMIIVGETVTKINTVVANSQQRKRQPDEWETEPDSKRSATDSLRDLETTVDGDVEEPIVNNDDDVLNEVDPDVTYSAATHLTESVDGDHHAEQTLYVNENDRDVPLY